MADPVLDLAGEIWKIIPIYPWLEVSSLGRIRRAATDDAPARLFTLWRTPKGYWVTSTSRFGKPVRMVTHRMVCLAFHGPSPEGKPLACHINGDPGDARAENLRWGSYKDNTADTRRHGRLPVGVKSGTAKLTELQVWAIRDLLKSNWTASEVAELFPTSKGNISAINTGKSWSHLV